MISQRVGTAANILPELVPRRRPAGEVILSDSDEGRAGRLQGYTKRIEQILGEVQPGAGKEVGTGKHGGVWQENLRTQGQRERPLAYDWGPAGNKHNRRGVRL